jgi:hypothetical protein
MRRTAHALLLFAAVVFLAFLFAQVEIQIEGSAGWAANLPTWRIEHHWLLDLLFGGRAMTGYHAWALPCILAFFHLPMVFTCVWSWRLEARAAAGFIFFWIAEDALWFIANPAFGWAKLTPEYATWHKHWLLGLPTDYLIFTAVGGFLFLWSFRTPYPRSSAPSSSPASCA